jgi:hypothetical protein
MVLTLLWEQHWLRMATVHVWSSSDRATRILLELPCDWLSVDIFICVFERVCGYEGT